MATRPVGEKSINKSDGYMWTNTWMWSVVRTGNLGWRFEPCLTHFFKCGRCSGKGCSLVVRCAWFKPWLLTCSFKFFNYWSWWSIFLFTRYMKVFLKFIDHDEIHGSNLDFLKKIRFLLFFLYITYFYLIFFNYWSWWSIFIFTRYMKVFKNLLIMMKCWNASLVELWRNWRNVIVFGLHIGLCIQHC
jgi:hypothetical protein